VLPSAATFLLLVGYILLAPSESSEAIRRSLGIGDGRLVAAPVVPEGTGSYAFRHTQEGSDEPVGYDPCQPIEVTVNPRGAPDNHDDLVDTGLRHISEATGLKFVRVSDTNDRDVHHGGVPRRRPVLIAWATPEEEPALAGNVVGIGGSIASGPPGRQRYVTGSVILDRDHFASLSSSVPSVGRDGDWDWEQDLGQATVDHELAHVVGLAHVEDHGELMHPSSMVRTTFGPGDREGLARLGAIDC